MSSFSAEWLALREPVDWRARSVAVTDAVADALRGRPVIRAVDLAAGTGSNTRFLAERLPAPQDWLLIDHDRLLLDRTRRQISFTVRTQLADLSRTDAITKYLTARDLVTASALLDLVSDEWARALCAACLAQRAVVLFALSYDGRMDFLPREPEDELVRTLVNRHQQRDKGFGRALGPGAPDAVATHLEALGYHVVRDRSDWTIEPDLDALQRELLAGWVAAAEEIAPGEADAIRAWRTRRLDHIVHRRSRMIVGHEDIGAFIA